MSYEKMIAAALQRGPLTASTLAKDIDFGRATPENVTSILESMQARGLVEQWGRLWRLPS